MIDQKYGTVIIPHLLVLGHDHVQIVQHEPVSIEPCRDDGVVLFPDVVPQDDDPEVIGGNPGLLESNEFCDRVIFAIPGTSGECGKRRAPDILRTVQR
jgi:hypothetical protein